MVDGINNAQQVYASQLPNEIPQNEQLPCKVDLSDPIDTGEFSTSKAKNTQKKGKGSLFRKLATAFAVSKFRTPGVGQFLNGDRGKALKHFGVFAACSAAAVGGLLVSGPVGGALIISALVGATINGAVSIVDAIKNA